MLQARNAATQAKRKATLNNLFEKWDNDASGFLDLDNVVDVMCKFKEGQEVEVIRLGKLFKSKGKGSLYCAIEASGEVLCYYPYFL